MINSRKNSYAWLVEKIKSNDFMTSFFGYRYGTDCQPTGTGKASEQIIDCAFKIKFSGDRQIVFNFASHRLALSYQLAGNLIYCLKEAGYITPENACIVINSSDSADKYNNDPDMGQFRSIGLDEINNTRKQYIFVVSCYKSHPKIEDYLVNNLKDAYKVSYWDEAHLVSVTDTEVESNVNVSKSLKVFDSVLAFSATPKDEVTRALEAREEEVNPKFHVGTSFRNYLKHITIKEAITNKTILPVSFNTITSSSLETVGDKGKLCLEVLKNLKGKTNKLNHKILISLDRKEDVKELLAFFKSKGKMAFATTSKYGFESTDESLNTFLQNGTIKDFTDTIRNRDEDCFVIHIRQLIEGIDIDCLTSAIIFDCPNDVNKIELIQTIGRILRFYYRSDIGKTERGMNVEDRVKKFGYIYWAMTPDCLESWGRKIAEFYLRTYDCGDCECRIGSGDRHNSNGDGESVSLNSSFHNGFDDLFNSVGGNHYELSPVFINTIDALIQFLPYQHITIPNSIQYCQLKNIIEGRIEGCVKEVYTTEEWSVSPAEIENAKNLMINKEPKLEKLFEFFEIVNKEN